MSQDAVKKLKKGDVLFKENDPCSTIYVIQSGKLGLFVERSGKRIQIGTAGGYQVLGEQAIVTNARHICGAEALQQATVLELPAEPMKLLFEKFPAAPRALIRGLIEEAKQARMAMRSLGLEGDKSPCPQMSIARLFTLVHLISRHVGKKDPANPDNVTISWGSFKTYAIRFFAESPQRLRTLMDVLLKLKIASFEVKVSEEGEEDLMNLKFGHVQAIEDFAEFYQFHLFKGPKADAIYVDPLALRVAKALVEFSEGAPVDHRGGTVVDYAQVCRQFKDKFKQELNNTHLDTLERKGLFVTRRNMEGGQLVLVFDRTEFSKMTFYWSIIAELDKWNQKGFVDLNEKEEVFTEAKATCGQCAGEIGDGQKFCPNCGFKLAA